MMNLQRKFSVPSSQFSAVVTLLPAVDPALTPLELVD